MLFFVLQFSLVQQCPHSITDTLGTTTCYSAMQGCEALGNLWQHTTHSGSCWQRELLPPYCTVKKEAFYTHSESPEWKSRKPGNIHTSSVDVFSVIPFLILFLSSFSLRLVSCVLTSWCKQVWRWVLAAMRSTSWCIDTCRSQVGGTTTQITTNIFTKKTVTSLLKIKKITLKIPFTLPLWVSVYHKRRLFEECHIECYLVSLHSRKINSYMYIYFRMSHY